MEYICIGNIVSTHGLKGEIKIISDFQFKSIIFNKNNHIYIGKMKMKECIRTYRIHKIYDMVTFDGIDNIDEVLKYKGEKVYIKKDEFVFPELLNQDLIGLEVYGDNRLVGKVTDIINNGAHDILVIDKKYLVPKVDEYILKINKKRINIKVVEGLLDED